MRNNSMIFSIVSLVILVFGGALSFFVKDPIIGKVTVFVFGVLVSTSLISICNAQPSSIDKINEEHYRQSVVEDLYNRLGSVEDRLQNSIDNVRHDLYDVENRMIDFEHNKKK